MQPEIRQEPSGWWLPKDDRYFDQFAPPPEFREGPPPKKNGFYRPHLLEAFKHVRAWDVAIDVGSHCGYWCHEMAQRFKTVYAFEPAQTNYECLAKNVAEFDNVYLYPFAVGDKRGSCEIRNDKTRPGNSGSNYIVPGGGNVPVVTLDEMEFKGCDFLKVDVEGFELRVLQGASELIKRYRPTISMEVTDFKFKGRYGIPEGQAQRWLLKRGYQMVWHQRPDAVFVPA